jgi:hypothetical protein
MSRAFKNISAKSTMGSLTKDKYQSEYISDKKTKLLYSQCKKTCNKLTKASNYENYNAFLNNKYINYRNALPFNAGNLVAGLHSKMNLQNICTVSNGSPCSQDNNCSGCLTGAIIDTNSDQIFNQVATIDPLGSLFGKPMFGINNFTSYIYHNYN